MGTFSILNNISALNGQHQLNVNSINLNRTLNRMASGLRINSGADDAAGLQIADTLRANVFALNQAIRNANDGLSFLQIADGALSEITNMLTRMVTLAEEAANEPIDERGRQALNNEFQELQAEIGRLALQTNFNGTPLFKVGRAFGNTLDLYVGDISENSSISVVMGYVNVARASFASHKEILESIDSATAIRDTAEASIGVISGALSTAITGLRTAENTYLPLKAAFEKARADYETAYQVFTNNPTNSLAATEFTAALGVYTAAQTAYKGAKVAYDDAKVEYTTQKTKFDAAKTRFDNADASLERLGRTQVAIEELALQAAQHAGLTGTTIDDIEDEVKALELVVQGGTANAEQMKQYEKFYEVFDGRDKVIGFMRNAETTNASMHNVNLLTHASAADSLRSIRDALNEISNMRGTIGAGMNRLLAGISVMQTQSRNTLSAESSIRDANMAEEITSMTRYQILAQTGIAALAHSNANSQTVLRLLQ